MKDTQRNHVFPVQGSAKSSAKSGVVYSYTEMYRYIFSKGLLCLLNNMLTEEVCVVSYDHHYDSLVKQKCKDRH